MRRLNRIVADLSVCFGLPTPSTMFYLCLLLLFVVSLAGSGAAVYAEPQQPPHTGDPSIYDPYTITVTTPPLVQPNSSVELTATITGVMPWAIGNFSVDWAIPGAPVQTTQLSLSNNGVVSSRLTYSFSTIGSFPITATLFWSFQGNRNPVKQDAETILVRGGTLGITPPAPVLTVNEESTFTVSLPPARQGSYRLVVDFGNGAPPRTQVITVSTTAATNTTLKQTYSSIGEFPLSARLYPESGATTPETQLAATVPTSIRVGGGTLGVTPPAPILTVNEEATFTVSLPPARQGNYRFVVDFGDGSPPRTEVITVSTTAAITTTLKQTYRKIGVFQLRAELYSGVNSGTSDNPLTSMNPISIIVKGPIYVPLIAKLLFPSCNGTGNNNTLNGMQPLDPSPIATSLLRQHKPYSFKSYVGGTPPSLIQSYYLVELQPNEQIEIRLNRIEVGTDLDLYLYRGRSALAANLVASSRLNGQLEEQIIFRNQGETSQEFTLRVYAAAIADLNNRNYLLTTQILPPCNGTGGNSTLNGMQPLDPSDNLLRQTPPYRCPSYVGGTPPALIQSYYLVELQPNEQIEVTLNGIEAGTDLDLYLYQGRSALAANLVASSRLNGQLEEKITFRHQGNTSQAFTLRVYAAAIADLSNRNYLLTAQIVPLQ